MALTNKLSAIGEAIRAKTGGTELLTLDEMPVAINSIETGGGGEGLPEEVFILTGDCKYRFAFNNWKWFIDNYGNKLTSSDIKDISNMFYESSEIVNVPFDINCSKDDGGAGSTQYMFYLCTALESCPKINGMYPTSVTNMFYGCHNLRNIYDGFGDNWDWSYMNTSKYSSFASMFQECRSLRSAPVHVFKNACPTMNAYNYSLYNNGFKMCNALDEIVNLPVVPTTAAATSNLFRSTFDGCYRAKNITFETNEDGTPKVVQWKSQTITLSAVGHHGYPALFNTEEQHLAYAKDNAFVNYNSGITSDKYVYNDATYQALKDDPDWFTAGNSSDSLYPYSRYNHDSAVATINSLPDTSAYLATAGGNNTITFRGNAGSATDGGAINTLTEEEIAVAAAKGWTVSFV